MKEGNIERNDVSKKDRLLLFIILFLPCLLIINKILDNDIWFLLNSGRYVLEHGIPHIEPFTIHDDFEFLMQQWLSACTFWIVYSNFGAFGLNVLVFICYAFLVFIIFKLCMKVSEEYFFMSFVLTLFASIMVSFFMVQRPSIFSTLILAAELYLLESYVISKNSRYLIILPTLSVILINLQAAMWPMLFVLMTPYLIDSFGFKIGIIAGQGYKRKGLFIALFFMLIFGMINPYGIDSMTYLARSYGHAEISNGVLEMLPPVINSIFGIIIFGCIFVVIATYIFYRKGSTKLRYVLLTLGTTYMALTSVRNFSFFAICATFSLAYYLKDARIPVRQNETTNKTLLLRKILIGLLIVVIIFYFYKTGNNNNEANDEYAKLRSTVEYLKSNEDVSKVMLYTGYNDGGMAEFLGVPAYIDPRAEVFVKENNKKSDVMEEYIFLQSGNIYYKEFLDKYDFTHLILTKNDILYLNLIHDSSYFISYANESYALFKKKIN